MTRNEDAWGCMRMQRHRHTCLACVYMRDSVGAYMLLLVWVSIMYVFFSHVHASYLQRSVDVFKLVQYLCSVPNRMRWTQGKLGQEALAAAARMGCSLPRDWLGKYPLVIQPGNGKSPTTAHGNAQKCTEMQLEVLTLMCNFQDDVPTIPNMSMSQLIGCFFLLIDPVVSPSPLCHPSVHSGGKLCQLNRLQNAAFTWTTSLATKCCWGFWWRINGQCCSLQNASCQLKVRAVKPFCSETVCIASSSTKWMYMHDRISLLNVGRWFSWSAKSGYIYIYILEVS